MNGILLLDKPQGLSSHDVVARIRRALGTREVGHGGTLDPNATGLLVIAVGHATRWLPYLPGDKRYAATLKLGLATDTEDIWGLETARDERPAPPAEELKKALESLVELREQVPPMVSALKQDGRRLYELAREGQVVERAARPVEIKAVTVSALRGLEADFTVDCGAGTYVRTLCVEAGKRLGRPACLSALRRLRHGGLRVEDALPEARWTKDALEASLLGADAALAHLPAHACSDGEAADLGFGRALKLDQRPQAGAWRLNHQGRLLALAEASTEEPWRLQPRRVFA
jgi:tRNA pseudouridine55 synthase